MTRSVAVVAHSHWDREWYAPFEAYRVRLVAMMDDLIELLESGRLAHFHLDGQVAALADYLEVRPQQRDRTAALVAAGRLAVGPWYVLMDEFCVSGETILRNLEAGIEAAERYGATAFCGYLPDMFGHAAQMPQILAQAGIADAVVWRGVPAAIRSSRFVWVAPDGSRVAAEYLPVGYASGAFLPKTPEALLRRLDAHEAEIGSFLGPDRTMLLMNGGDHQPPQEWVPELVAQLNATQDRFAVAITSLAGFLSAQPDPDGPQWCGELRSGARAPILMGVLSNRVDVKQAAARAEAVVEKQAEPLAALWLPPAMWPADRLDAAWRNMILNSAHDSICACSADPVGRAVLARYDTVHAVAESVRADALAIAGVATAPAGTVVVNSLPFERDGLVEVDLPGVDPRPGTQPLAQRPAATSQRVVPGAELARVLAELAAAGDLGPTGRPDQAELSPPGPPLVVTLFVDAARRPDPQVAAVMAEAWARAGAAGADPITVRVVQHASQRVLAHVASVPGWGWTMLAPRLPATGAVGVRPGPGGDATVVLDNGLLSARVGPDGLIGLSDRRHGCDPAEGLNRISEQADEGDTYNFCPAAGDPRPVDEPTAVSVRRLEDGPLRAVVQVVRSYPWTPPVEVVSEVELRAGEPIVRVRTWFDHIGRDHRIRAVFPLPHPTATTRAECAFTAVERSGAEGGPQEPALATFPSRRFVSAGGLTVFHHGLLEYELVEDGSALALTLLRAVGTLSRPAPASRPNVAGPPLELRDTQLPGRRSFSYAAGLDVSDPWAVADHLAAPLAAVAATGGGPLAGRGQRLAVDAGEVKVSSLRRRRGAIEVRLFNPHRRPATAVLAGHAGTLVDLRGRTVGRWDGRIVVGPNRFVTARLERADLDA